MMTTTNEKLRALGYGAGTAEITRFQRDHNNRGPKQRLLVTGQLDDATREAVELDHESRELLAILGKGGR